MQTIILAGGSGTRLREMTEFMPKALVPIGGKPLIWHIMKIYAHHGFTDFVLALGYMQEAFKNYFCNFDAINCDVRISRSLFGEGYICPLNVTDKWNIILSDTGAKTLKDKRLKSIEKYIEGNTFMVTYGDGVSDINLNALLEFHKSHGKIATITGVHPAPRFGEIHHKHGLIKSFSEKPFDDGCLMNGGFMVFDRGIFNYLYDDSNGDLETTVFNELIENEQLMVFKHSGFWKSCDTLKDMEELRDMWEADEADWRVW